MAHTADHVRAQLPKIYSRELVELVFVQPYCRIQNIVEAGLGHRQTASVYLKALVDIGVLKEEKVGREKLFIHPKYMQLLTGDSHEFSPYGQAGAPADGRSTAQPAKKWPQDRGQETENRMSRKFDKHQAGSSEVAADHHLCARGCAGGASGERGAEFAGEVGV